MVAISEFPSIRLEFSLGVLLRAFSKHRRLLKPSAATTSSKKKQFFYNVALIFILVAIIPLGYCSIYSRLIIEMRCQGDTARQSEQHPDFLLKVNE